MRILLIEDDIEAADYIAQGLRDEGHELHIASNGRSGLLQASGDDWDLLIIDRMLPSLDGLALTRTLRAADITTPVLFLTALGGIDDRVSGLDRRQTALANEDSEELPQGLDRDDESALGRSRNQRARGSDASVVPKALCVHEYVRVERRPDQS